MMKLVTGREHSAPYGEQENNKDVLEFIENRCKLTEYKR